MLSQPVSRDLGVVLHYRAEIKGVVLTWGSLRKGVAVPIGVPGDTTRFALVEELYRVSLRTRPRHTMGSSANHMTGNFR